MDCYDRQGRPISMDEWSRRRPAEIVVAKTDVTDEVQVSTVWLGLNHQFGNGPPLIFETMIFGGPLSESQWRYSTEVEALAGHEHAVKQATTARHAEFGEVTDHA